MIAYKVTIEYVWGFSCNVAGYSKSPQPFLYPPPSTIIGAIISSIAKDYNMDENAIRYLLPVFSANVIGFGFRYDNAIPIPYSDINRIITVGLKGGKLYPNPKELSKSFDAPARGKTILAAIDNNPPILDYILILKNDIIELPDHFIKIADKHFWHINRVGSKESIVSVTDVKFTSSVSILNDTWIETTYSFPIRGYKYVTYGQWRMEEYLNPFNVNDTWQPTSNYISGKNLIRYMVPIPWIDISKAKIMVPTEIAAYKVFNQVILDVK